MTVPEVSFGDFVRFLQAGCFSLC